MPILKTKHDHVKTYRPNGSRYAEGGALSTEIDPFDVAGDYIPNSDIGFCAAACRAMAEFQEEFNRLPIQEKTVIEVHGVTGKWIATVYEVDEEGR